MNSKRGTNLPCREQQISNDREFKPLKSFQPFKPPPFSSPAVPGEEEFFGVFRAMSDGLNGLNRFSARSPRSSLSVTLYNAFSSEHDVRHRCDSPYLPTFAALTVLSVRVTTPAS